MGQVLGHFECAQVLSFGVANGEIADVDELAVEVDPEFGHVALARRGSRPGFFAPCARLPADGNFEPCGPRMVLVRLKIWSGLSEK